MPATDAIEKKIRELFLEFLKEHGLDLDKFNQQIAIKSLVYCGGNQDLSLEIVTKVAEKIRQEGFLDKY